MGLKFEDELVKLSDSAAAEILVAEFVRDVGDGVFVVKFLDTELPATALDGFLSPDEGTVVAVIKAGLQLLILGGLAG